MKVHDLLLLRDKSSPPRLRQLVPACALKRRENPRSQSSAGNERTYRATGAVSKLMSDDSPAKRNRQPYPPSSSHVSPQTDTSYRVCTSSSESCPFLLPFSKVTAQPGDTPSGRLSKGNLWPRSKTKAHQSGPARREPAGVLIGAKEKHGERCPLLTE